MHILIIPSEEFIPDQNPLSGTFQYDQARILIEAGHTVGVISIELKFSIPRIVRAILLRFLFLKTENETDNYNIFKLFILLIQKIFYPSVFIVHEIRDGINIYRSEGFYWFGASALNNNKFWIAAGLLAYKKYVKDNKPPDIIHTHNSLYAGLLGVKIKNKYNLPFVLTEHSSYFSRQLYHSSLLPKAQKAFKTANALLVVSNFLGEELDIIFNKSFKWSVLPNVVEPLFEKCNIIQNKSKVFLFISIGDLIKLKQHSLLINAFHKAFSPSNNEVILEIIGDGPEEKSLRNLINQLGENQRIFLRGRFTKQEILEKLSASKVLCLQSDYETFGVVVLEALFRGVPVIVTKCGGPDNIVEITDGIIIPVNNEVALIKALKDIKDNYSIYQPDKIRERAIERYGADKFLEKLFIFYNQCLTI